MLSPLTLLDRVLLLNTLPVKDSFERLVLRKDVLAKVEPNQEEIEKYKIQSVGAQVKWEPSEDIFDISFTEAEVNYVREILRELSTQKQLTAQHFSIYEMFVNEKGLKEEKKSKSEARREEAASAEKGVPQEA